VINTLQIKVTPPLNMSNNYTRTWHTPSQHNSLQLVSNSYVFLRLKSMACLQVSTHSSNRNDTLASPSAAPSKNLPAHKTAISTVPLEG
jgi:hypothetical protein